MAVKVTLEEASTEIGLITTLNAKMESLQDSLVQEHDRLKTNQAEILKRINLEESTKQIEAHIKSLKKEAASIKSQRDTKIAALTAAGWVIPVPKSNGAKAVVSM